MRSRLPALAAASMASGKAERVHGRFRRAYITKAQFSAEPLQPQRLHACLLCPVRACITLALWTGRTSPIHNVHASAEG